MKSTRQPVMRYLPAPTAGMYQAKRPTGIIAGVLISLLAIALSSAPVIIREFSARAAAGRLGETGLRLVTTSPTGWVAFLSFAITAGVIVLWVILKERRSLASFGFAWRTGAPNPAGSLARPQRIRPVAPQIAFGAILAIAMLTVCVLVPVITGHAELRWRAPELSAASLAVVAGLVFWFLFQGSSEEVLTRGYLTQLFARRWGLVVAIILQTIVFTAMHGNNQGLGVMPICNLVLFAVFASFISLAHGSLWSICAFHGVWNWAQGCLFGVAVSGGRVNETLFLYTPNPGSNELVTGGPFGVEGSLITSAAYLCGIVWAFLAYRRHTRVDAQAGDTAAS